MEQDSFQFLENDSIYRSKTIKTITRSNKEAFWYIEVKFYSGQERVSYNDETFQPKAIIKTYTWQKDGKIRESKGKEITRGKNIGKINETNAFTQAISEAKSKFALMERKRVNDNISINPPVMLIDKVSEKTLKKIDFKNCIIQKKYDGVRSACFIDNANELIFYSRTGIHFKCIRHIADILHPILSNITIENLDNEKFPVISGLSSIPKCYLDGELYIHQLPLNIISGLVRRINSNTEGQKLNYYVFDCFFPEIKANGIEVLSNERQNFLDLIIPEDHFPESDGSVGKVVRVHNYKVNDIDDFQHLVTDFWNDKYEGGIIRKNNSPYVYSINGYHTNEVLKYKKREDTEFRLVGFTEGVAKDTELVIWICETVDGKKFRVVPKGLTEPQRSYIFRRLNEKINDRTIFDIKFFGKMMTVEYSIINKETGVPQQPYAKGFRADNPSEVDPLSELLEQSTKITIPEILTPPENEIVLDMMKENIQPKKYFSELTHSIIFRDIKNQIPKEFRPYYNVKYRGQKKLFLAEYQFLMQYGKLSDTILYVGSAPGKHIVYLSNLFPKHRFILFDPREHDIQETGKIKIERKFFTEIEAREYENRPILFISDIRSGLEKEVAVRVDQYMQKRWIDIIKPVKCLLKFRCPFDLDNPLSDSIDGTGGLAVHGIYNYYDSDPWLQPFARVLSSETRIVVDADTPFKSYTIEYEQKMFAHNLNRLFGKFTTKSSDMFGELGDTWDFCRMMEICKKKTIINYLKPF